MTARRQRRILAVADDLTGALEAGARFAAYGLASVVTTGTYGGHEQPVVVLDTETRHASAQAAGTVIVQRAAGWDGLVYKKTDSTLRGNIGAELRALGSLYGGPVAYVPAYPDMGRTVAGGMLLVDGIPLAQTAFAFDPLNPVREGRVRSLLDEACACVVFDGRTNEDVEAAARQILDSGAYPIVAGPAAIGGALAALLGSPVPVHWPAAARCLVVNGSLHAASSAQIETALRAGAVATHAESDWRLLQGPGSHAGRAEELQRGGDPAEEALPGPLEIARETGAEAARLLRGGRFDAMLVIGGDTAYGVLHALGLPVLRPYGEIVPGVPVSAVEGRREVLITKAGGFGPPDLLVRLKEALRS